MSHNIKSSSIGFVGLGKLGLPVALAIESRGHKVVGTDINPAVEGYLNEKKIPYKEIFVDDLLPKSKISFTSLSEVVKNSDIIFVPVQTPHQPLYEGSTRLPSDRIDFNYEHLVDAILNISKQVDELNTEKIVVIISTVLPGTIEKYIKPVLSKKIKLCYNPFFIAMGTTIRDFLNPEFVLLGVDDEEAASYVQSFYNTLHNRPVYKTSVKNAELIKVAYNTYIGMKIVYANTMMEICHKIGADVDAVTGAMSLATERLMSPKYLRGGMGDGGGCHPRDNIAMSWLSNKLSLKHNFFEDLMVAREHQTEWLADLCLEQQLPIVILGKAFKPETNITTGSPAILLFNILKENEKNIEVVNFDPFVDENFSENTKGYLNSNNRHLYFLGTQHDIFKSLKYNKDSIIIDPFRYVNENDDYFIENNIKVIKIGYPPLTKVN
jgi:UDPglucose 6-dehydrogenase